MYQRILVPVDGSDTSSAGLREATRLAKMTGGQLRLLHVVDDLPYVLSGDAALSMAGDLFDLLFTAGKSLLEDSRARAVEHGVPADTVLCERLKGRVHEHVSEQAQAWKADLIVLGTHGRRGAQRAFLGSDAEQILRTAPVPVLLVRGTTAGSVD
jgi:nucleotide-binding universal stress UspA family protein